MRHTLAFNVRTRQRRRTYINVYAWNCRYQVVLVYNTSIFSDAVWRRQIFFVEMLIVERNCTKNVDGHQRTPSTGTVYVNNVPYQDKLKSVDADTWLQLEVEQIVNAFGNLRVCDGFYSMTGGWPEIRRTTLGALWPCLSSNTIGRTTTRCTTWCATLSLTHLILEAGHWVVLGLS